MSNNVPLSMSNSATMFHSSNAQQLMNNNALPQHHKVVEASLSNHAVQPTRLCAMELEVEAALSVLTEVEMDTDMGTIPDPDPLAVTALSALLLGIMDMQEGLDTTLDTGHTEEREKVSLYFLPTGVAVGQFLNKAVQLLQSRFVNPFLNRAVVLFQGKNVPPQLDNNAVLSLDNSVSLFQNK